MIEISWEEFLEMPDVGKEPWMSIAKTLVSSQQSTGSPPHDMKIPVIFELGFEAVWPYLLALLPEHVEIEVAS